MALAGVSSAVVPVQGTRALPVVRPSIPPAPLAASWCLSSQASRCSAQLTRPLLAARSLRVAAPRPVVVARVKWVLEPAGDGDSAHLDETVARPGAITLEGEAFVLGRVGDRSDIVISIPTVSGSHARIERKGDDLYVTDLNSTNGTFIDDARLKPGTPTLVANGNLVTFGDQHLAAFKAVQVIEAVDV